jgi:hypothetical protein
MSRSPTATPPSIMPTCSGPRTKLHRVVKNLITQATTGADVVDADGNVVVEGAGDLAAITEIFNRIEGKPSLMRRVNS